jgi:hypothetical protein
MFQKEPQAADTEELTRGEDDRSIVGLSFSSLVLTVGICAAVHQGLRYFQMPVATGTCERKIQIRLGVSSSAQDRMKPNCSPAFMTSSRVMSIERAPSKLESPLKTTPSSVL